MTAIDHSSAPHAPGLALGARIARAARRVYARFIEAQERRAAIIVLQSMSDRELEDIGITRGEIASRV